MAKYEKVTPIMNFMGKLSYSDDLLDALTTICTQENIILGRVEALGAVQRCNIGFYNQNTREYQFTKYDNPMEITNLIGNISLKDGKPMIHAHITLTDENGNTIGGHLGPGTEIFACEFVITVFEGTSFKRDYDKETGLPLWEM